MIVRVTVVGGADDGRESVLSAFPLTLGREGDVGLQIGDRWTSRKHCQIFVQDGALFVRDLASKHGTLVNGRRIDESPLAEGDRLMLGLTTLIVQQIASEVGPANQLIDQGSGVG